MTRDSEARLLQFCVRQSTAFDAAEWCSFSHPDPDELAAAALFLAGVDWYPHHAGLLEAAEALRPGCTGRLSALVSRTGFDCSRFSNMLRRQLAHAPVAS